MSLEYFIDIRFGDPVLALSMNSYGLLYGSSIGRILFYTFHAQQDQVIAEFSEECIRGCHITKDSTLFITVGDRYCILMNSPTSRKHLIHHDHTHVDEICLSSQVLTKNDLVCIVPLKTNTEALILTCISNSMKKKYPIGGFKPLSVTYDFDGDRLLWMEWEGKTRNFKYYDFAAMENRDIISFHISFGQIGFCRLVFGLLVFVKDFRTIVAYDVETGKEKEVIGTHFSDVVAMNWVRFKDKNVVSTDHNSGEVKMEEKVLVVAIDYRCNICFWERGVCLYRMNVTEFSELTEEYRQEFYFTMGYPYFLTVYERRVAFSTDIGVLVVSVPFLSQIFVITE